MIDLSKPEHREALRWACSFVGRVRADSVRRMIESDAAWEHADAARRVAIRTLSSPAESAELVRGLLKGRGVEAIVGPSRSVWCGPGDDPHPNRSAKTIAVCVDKLTFWIPVNKARALILCLLDATTREGALEALMEAT